MQLTKAQTHEPDSYTKMIFSVTYYLELHNAVCLFLLFMWVFYQIKLLVFYNVQPNNQFEHFFDQLSYDI